MAATPWLLLALASAGPVPPLPPADAGVAPTAPWRAQVERWAFCDAEGLHPLYVESLKKNEAVVRVAPLVVQISAQAPVVLVPTHVDELWPRRKVAPACLMAAPRFAPTPGPHPVEIVSQPELVFGCTQDPVGAHFIEGKLGRIAQLPARPATCLRHVDVRAACPASPPEDDERADEAGDDTGAGADDGPPDGGVAPHREAPVSAFDVERKRAQTLTRQLLSRVVPRYATAGPAMRVRAHTIPGTRRLFLVERLLESEACGCGEDSANVTSSSVVELQVPPLPDDTELWIPVPRYTGAAYDLVLAEDAEEVDADAVGRLSYSDPFVAEPPEDPAAVRAFSAPEACPCDC